MKKSHWHTFTNRQEQSLALAQQVARDIQQCLIHKREVKLCVPGGKTPALFLNALSEMELDWHNVIVLLNDERWVPTSNPQSNEAMLRKTLQCNNASDAMVIGFYPNDTAQAEQQDYIEELNKNHRLFLPIDICILGMGEDGHTASLFPGMKNLKEALDTQQPAALISAAPPGKESRVSLNLSALLSADKHYLLVTGPEKKAVITEALQQKQEQLPISYLFENTAVDIYYSD